MSEQKEVALYDDLGANYDLMVDWKSRLENELPFFEELFQKNGVKRVLDSACATGMHAVALAKLGYEVTGADPSVAMIKKAWVNARNNGVAVRFVQAGFGELAKEAGTGYDAVICLGNSLPHVTSDEHLRQTLSDMRRALKDGGLLIIQNRNWDRVWDGRIRFMPLNEAEENGKELLFFRMLDFHEADMDFSIVTFVKEHGKWNYSVSTTKLRPLFRDQMEEELKRAGFHSIEFYGDYKFLPWQIDETFDLICVAK